MKEYQAYSPHGRVTRNSPQAAAVAFFAQFPKARKCNIVEGTTDGPFFTVTYGRLSEGKWPYTAKDVTRKTVGELPS